MPPKNIAYLKPRDMVHVELVGPYSKSIIQQQTGGSIIKCKVSITGMTTIEPNTGWFEIIEVPTYDINDVTGGNEEYIDK